MFHPLVPDLKKLKDSDLDSKIFELTKKYHIAARYSQPGVCDQILVMLDMYKVEQQKRQFAAAQNLIKKQDKDLDGLINVD